MPFIPKNRKALVTTVVVVVVVLMLWMFMRPGSMPLRRRRVDEDLEATVVPTDAPMVHAMMPGAMPFKMVVDPATGEPIAVPTVDPTRFPSLPPEIMGFVDPADRSFGIV
jgi:hypothetical protein